MKVKAKFIGLVLTGSMALMYACGGGEQQTSSTDEQSEVNTTTPPAAVESVDPDSKSDSKGVGRFTSVPVGPIDNAMAAKGKEVFTSKCMACHRATDEKIVGPGLKGVTKLRTPEWIMNMITNPEEMTKKDPWAKALFEKHLVQMTFQNVSDDEARQILEFLRKNDAD
ncbi:cytochrome c [Pedobacter sp. BS3]|uniref:c-type cytochrome n=1 Tax=Pedobacter sp. BS3 TaxID=2567937 RepID=UPI0011EE5027|nr:cytochrome c [Pedobacter sp. BS3]TZF84800.1 cytochrome c [Pedobacter sp. BS3]